MNPAHEAIAHRAHQLWQDQGRPDGREDETWLLAERQLTAKAPDPQPETTGAAFAAYVRTETAVESEIEFQITPAIDEEAAIQAAIHQPAAHAPQVATTRARKPSPPRPGKPSGPNLTRPAGGVVSTTDRSPDPGP